MKGEEVFDFHLGEKVYTLDTYHDESIDLIAVGLKNTILIYQISDEKENNETKPTLIQAVSNVLLKYIKGIPISLLQKLVITYWLENSSGPNISDFGPRVRQGFQKIKKFISAEIISSNFAIKAIS